MTTFLRNPLRTVFFVAFVSIILLSRLRLRIMRRENRLTLPQRRLTMKISTTLTSVALLLICTAALVKADIARPEPKPTEPRPSKHLLTTGLEIAPDSKTYNARLQISEATLKQLQEAMNEGATTGSFGQGITRSSTNTIIAGLFLCLSISFGGVWLARSSAK